MMHDTGHEAEVGAHYTPEVAHTPEPEWHAHERRSVHWKRRVVAYAAVAGIAASLLTHAGFTFYSPGQNLTALRARVDTNTVSIKTHNIRLDSLERGLRTNIKLTCRVLEVVQQPHAILPAECP